MSKHRLVMPPLEVGSVIWRFDENSRVYRPAVPGQLSRGPIYRQYWRETSIVSETATHWLTPAGHRIPKDGRAPKERFALSRQELEDEVLVHGHQAEISFRVLRLKDVEKLRKIADLLGYDPEKEDTI